MDLENLIQNIPPEVMEFSQLSYEFSGLFLGLMSAVGFLMKNRRFGTIIGVTGSLALVTKVGLDIFGITNGTTDISNLAGDTGGLMIALLSIREAMKRREKS